VRQRELKGFTRVIHALYPSAFVCKIADDFPQKCGFSPCRRVYAKSLTHEPGLFLNTVDYSAPDPFELSLVSIVFLAQVK
jgi:hypothetical protein